VTDGQRGVVVGRGRSLGGHELVPGHGRHGAQHRLVVHPVALDGVDHAVSIRLPLDDPRPGLGRFGGAGRRSGRLGERQEPGEHQDPGEPADRAAAVHEQALHRHFTDTWYWNPVFRAMKGVFSYL